MEVEFPSKVVLPPKVLGATTVVFEMGATVAAGMHSGSGGHVTCLR